MTSTYVIITLCCAGSDGTFCNYSVTLNAKAQEKLGQISPQRGEGELGKTLPILDPPHTSRMAEARDLKFCMLTEGRGSNKNYAKIDHKGSGRGHMT